LAAGSVAGSPSGPSVDDATVKIGL
jgi:hypothetical protein